VRKAARLASARSLATRVFFPRQVQALEHPADSCLTHLALQLADHLRLDFFPCGVVLLLHAIAPHHLALGASKLRYVSSPRRFGGQSPALAAWPQELFDERTANPKQARYFLLRPNLLVYRTHHPRA